MKIYEGVEDMSNGVEVPGNVLATAALVEREISRCGKALFDLQDWAEALARKDVLITELRISARYGIEGELLGIIKAEAKGEPKIAFLTGTTIPELLRTMANKAKNGSLRWREDRPYDERGQADD